ncbi:MAG: ABC transporter permease [Salibacteraceae bacterium]|jgi:cell division transport system permease protein|nr:ABC transporter permease [Salibacteraceae bacterium]MDP4687566.1 ABC transporter permease [Salibacteraceae bacterium]MDP4762612.1 ABC transporter permease [Salibacteraceae bacterium]MDP4844900.1 ABC transporter permease [Salibacteraceae bacterium]MDP4935418.1 ABC transporter permease [Salibacteraceae bacterium]
MAKKGEQTFQKRRLRGSYISVILSVALVLFTLGLLGLIMLYAQKLSNTVKENIGFTIYLQDDVKEVDVVRLQKAIELAPYSKSTVFISKDEAVEIMKKDLGEDFMNYLDYNPLSACIEVKLNAEYAHQDSLAGIKAQLQRSSKIKEVDYQESLVSSVQKNIRKVGMVLLAFSALLLVVAIALINNSIRLSIYSKRFLIKSMQLVGATQSFIRKPFIIKGIFHGIYSALIAIMLIMSLMYVSQQYLPDLIQIQDIEILAYLFVIVLILGVVISWVSTSLAVRKFLRMRSDKMY